MSKVTRKLRGRSYVDRSASASVETNSIVVGGVAVTATPAQLNELADGSTTALHEHELAEGANDVNATAAELDELTDGSTTVLHEHELTAGANDVTATAAELNELADGSTTALHEHTLAVGANDVNATAAQLNTVVFLQPTRSHQTLEIAADVVDEDEFTLGDDTFEVEVLTVAGVNTADNADGVIAIDAVSPITVHFAADPGLDVGQLFRISDEIFRVTVVDGADDEIITADREVHGTVAEAHVQDSVTFVGDGLTDPAHIAVGFGVTLTAAQARTTFPIAYNESSTEGYAMITLAGNYLGVLENTASSTNVPTSSTFFGANLWHGDSTVGGKAAAPSRIAKHFHTVTADEVTAGVIYIPVDYVPAGVVWRVHDGTGAPVAFDGTFAIATLSLQDYLVVTDGGAVNLTADDEISIIAFE